MRLPRWLPLTLIALGAVTPSMAAAIFPAEHVAQLAPARLAWLVRLSAGVLLLGLVLSVRTLFVPPVARTRFQVAVVMLGAVILAMQLAIFVLFFRP